MPYLPVERERALDYLTSCADRDCVDYHVIRDEYEVSTMIYAEDRPHLDGVGRLISMQVMALRDHKPLCYSIATRFLESLIKDAAEGTLTYKNLCHIHSKYEVSPELIGDIYNADRLYSDRTIIIAEEDEEEADLEYDEEYGYREYEYDEDGEYEDGEYEDYDEDDEDEDYDEDEDEEYEDDDYEEEYEYEDEDDDEYCEDYEEVEDEDEEYLAYIDEDDLEYKEELDEISAKRSPEFVKVYDILDRREPSLIDSPDRYDEFKSEQEVDGEIIMQLCEIADYKDMLTLGCLLSIRTDVEIENKKKIQGTNVVRYYESEAKERLFDTFVVLINFK